MKPRARLRLRHRLALTTAGLAAGNVAALAWRPALGRRLMAWQCGLLAGWVSVRMAAEPLSFPVWPNGAAWPAYPISSYRLFGLDEERPETGRRFVQRIPQVHYGAAGWRVNPALVSWWAVAQLTLALTIPAGESARELFAAQLTWLRANAVTGPLGGAVWHYDFPWREGRARLRPPWVSAMAQGLAISALVRSWTLDGRRSDLDLARRAAAVFAVPAEQGGVRVEEGPDVFYEEYPAAPYARVLDGFAFAVLGLHDLATHGNDDEAAAHFRSGIATLARRIGDWDFAGCWSWYGRHGLLATPQYNSLNACLARVLGALAAAPQLAAAGERWSPERRPWSRSALIRVVAPLLWARFKLLEACSRV